MGNMVANTGGRATSRRLCRWLAKTGLAAVLLVIIATPAIAAGLAEAGSQRLGTKITIQVENGDRAYRFVAAILALDDGVAYEWFTTSPVASVGHRKISAEMLASAQAFCACHRDGEFGPVQDAPSLWVSHQVLEDLTRTGAASFRFNRLGTEMTDTRLVFLRRDTLDVSVDGQTVPLLVVVARADSGTTFWIHDNPADPLVLRVKGDWSSRVTSIVQRPDDHLGTVRQINGRGLHTLDRGQGDPVFVLHGGPGMEFDYFLPFLDGLEADARLIYIDQPGHGLSERFPPTEPYTMDGAIAAIEGLREALGLETITLLGHSYGGFVSQLYATRYPSRVARLILVDTAPSWEWGLEANANINRLGTRQQRNPPRGLSDDERLRIVFPLYFFPQDRSVSEAFMDRVILSPGPWRQLTRTAQFRFFDMREALAEITAPTLVLVGANDIITTPNQAQILADILPNARLHIFPDTGHNPFVEETEEFNKVIAEFLASTAEQ